MEVVRDAGPKLKSFFYHVCKPSDPSRIKGSVVVLHGAEGYGGRYEPFGEELAKHGYAMYAVDHIGHGKTIMDEEDDLGKWEDKDFYYSAYNAYYLVDKLKHMYPEKPVYVLGDDYGGTMAQYMMDEFENVFDGVIISSCGVPSAKDYSMFFKCWLKKVLFYDGAKSKGTFKSRTRFLNMHYRPTRTKYDWLNSDPKEVDRFIEDPLAGYVCTIGYYYYQYKYIVSTPRKFKMKKANKEMPILMIGGADDYITHRGKQVLKLKDAYERKGFKNVDSILYDRSRHDVLLEWNKDQVAIDIARWMNKNSYNAETVNYTDRKQITEVKAIEYKDTKVEVVQDVPQADFVEEEPYDELRLSTKMKKED